jgi:serine protease Do
LVSDNAYLLRGGNAGRGFSRFHPRRARIATLAAITAVGLLVFGSGAMARPAPDGFADLVEKLVPAVVNISTSQTIKAQGNAPGPDMPQFPPGSPFEEFFKNYFDKQQNQQRSRKVTSLGSGFIVDPAGYIVTNNHVIADADEVTVTLQDGAESEFTAKVVGRDSKMDLALLKVEAHRPLPYVSWGDSDKARVGDWVVAIGNPFGLGGTVTAGIVSARARELNSGPYDDFIQTDAAINKGNSGGPMFDMDGKVIGINSAIYSPTGGSVGIGFAIPSSLARPVVEQLRKYGHARRGWLGVRIQTVSDEIAETLGLPKTSGALVASVTTAGPAEQSGIQAGDVILEFDHHEVGEMRHLPRMVAETDIGKPVDVEVWRKGKKVDLTVKVGELPESETEAADESESAKPKVEAPTKEQKVDSLGLSLAPLSQALRDQYEIGAEVKGVVVTEVKDGGPAAEKELKAGDVIVEVSQEEVSSPAQVASHIEAARSAGQKSVLLLVERAGDLRFIAVKLGTG